MKPDSMARLRFRPPPIEPTPELTWLLQAAFAESFPPPLAETGDSSVLALADRLGLASQIGGRLRSSSRSPALPDSMAAKFLQARAHSAIRAVVLERTARQIAHSAEQMSVPITFLKGFALFLTGRDCSGGRAIGDLDVLAPRTSARALHAELRRLGYHSEGESGNEHHLATLLAPEGSSVDLHFFVRSLSFERPGWATWEILNERGALVPVEGFPGNCTVPELGVQATHLLVHGLAHHAWRPHTYPLLRLIGDLQQLLPDRRSWQDFLSTHRSVLLHTVNEAELRAIRRLVLELGAGHVPDLGSPRPSDDATLLRHILAGYLDESYGRRLWLRHTLNRLGEAARQGRLGNYLRRKARLQRVD